QATTMDPSFTNQPRVIATTSRIDEAIDLFRKNEQVTSFLEIAVGETRETARRFLQRTDWKIDEAINLYLTNNNTTLIEGSTTSGTSDDDSDSSSSSSFSPPFYMLQEGSFVDAKSVSIGNNKWLIVNLQSRKELASRTLNQDVWGNEAVSLAVEPNFFLWQVYNDTVEGRKVSSFYRVESAPPVVLVIDPITGQKMGMWSGEIEADSLLEDLMKYTDAGPHEYIASLTRYRHTETTETCLSSNNAYEPPPPSWGEDFENEDNNQVAAPCWDQAYENQDQAYEYQDQPYEDQDQAYNEDQDQEYEDEDEREVWSSVRESDDFVPPFIGEEYAETDEDEACIEFPVLTEEPKGDIDPSLVCNLCVRFPDGRRKQRKFLESEPVQLLWSFCYSQMDESEKKAFSLVQAIPGASKTLDYGDDATFEQSRLANSMISVTWQ
ncbi:hypothetical protein CARUB_v10007447mg, partial [Capsella rubella]